MSKQEKTQEIQEKETKKVSRLPDFAVTALSWGGNRINRNDFDPGIVESQSVFKGII